jgi:peptidoglycan/LPS O-acetylase OafA/YrhL
MGSGTLSGSERLPSLDGWRAFSIALVLVGHSTRAAGFPAEWLPAFNWLSFGGFGVRTFFVISGFLITWLMLREEHHRGGISLRRFYARRALRILPVYFAFLGVVAAAQCFTPFSQDRGAWLANLTFTTGLFSWGGDGIPWTTGHLWSLAVEEQFYIVWPVVFVSLSLGAKTSLALAILALPVLLAPVCRVIGYVGLAPGALSEFFGSYAFTSNFDALAIGCGAAILLFHHPDKVGRFVLGRARAVAVAGVLLVVVPHVVSGLLVAGYLTVPFAATLQSVGVVLLILQSVLRPKSGVYPLLNLRMVAWIGVLSYSLYMATIALHESGCLRSW